MAAKIINLKNYRFLRERKSAEEVYRNQLLAMEKADLLQELLRYHESYQNDPMDLAATIRGQQLMEVLEMRAELKELQELANDFKRKLGIRLYEQMQGIGDR